MGMESTFDHRTITRVLFTQPQVTCIGLTSKEAKKTGYNVVAGAGPLSMNPFSMIISQNEGLVEVVAEKEYGEVIGIHFIGHGTFEMAGQIVLAIQMEATLEELALATFPHSTLSESLAEASRECLGKSIIIPDFKQTRPKLLQYFSIHRFFLQAEVKKKRCQVNHNLQRSTHNFFRNDPSRNQIWPPYRICSVELVISQSRIAGL